MSTVCDGFSVGIAERIGNGEAQAATRNVSRDSVNLMASVSKVYGRIVSGMRRVGQLVPGSRSAGVGHDGSPIVPERGPVNIFHAEPSLTLVTLDGGSLPATFSAGLDNERSMRAQG